MLELYHRPEGTAGPGGEGARLDRSPPNLRTADQQKPDYLALNPNGVVQTIRQFGTVVIESTVIDEYLDDAYLVPPLRPEDASARSPMRL